MKNNTYQKLSRFTRQFLPLLTNNMILFEFYNSILESRVQTKRSKTRFQCKWKVFKWSFVQDNGFCSNVSRLGKCRMTEGIEEPDSYNGKERVGEEERVRKEGMVREIGRDFLNQGERRIGKAKKV